MADPEFELLVVGAGPAGLSAALWAEELGMSALVLDSRGEAGGQLLMTYNPIQNHLGVQTANGRELRDLFIENLLKRDIKFRFNARVVAVDPEKKSVEIASPDLKHLETISYRYLVFGTGVSRRKLGIPGENKFLDNGILRSGKRECSEAEGKNAVVIGGGDAAFENALILAKYARLVTLVHRRDAFLARKEFQEAVGREARIKVLTNRMATRFSGRGELESVFVRDLKSGDESELAAETAVIRIGVEPNSGVLRNHVGTDANGYIKVDSECKTSISSIYAVGDVANPASPTVSTAVGMGSTSIKSIRSGPSR